MIAKLICWDVDKSMTIKRMKRALAEFQISGLTTNINFLSYIVNKKEFMTGDYDINFIDKLNAAGFENENIYASEKDKEVAASILAVLIKTKNNYPLKTKYSVKDNGWWEQNYE